MTLKFFDAQFLISYAKLVRRRKSQPVPESNTGPVKIAVADNFDTVVTNSGRDAFVQFYKPTCPHCKKLAPIWDELGEVMKNEAVDIVKMDAIANDCPAPYEVKRYPVIYIKFADSSKSPLKYTKERTLKTFIRFIAKHATTELSGWDRKGKPKMLKIK